MRLSGRAAPWYLDGLGALYGLPARCLAPWRLRRCHGEDEPPQHYLVGLAEQGGEIADSPRSASTVRRSPSTAASRPVTRPVSFPHGCAQRQVRLGCASDRRQAASRCWYGRAGLSADSATWCGHSRRRRAREISPLRSVIVARDRV